jgi:hypothetical protein
LEPEQIIDPRRWRQGSTAGLAGIHLLRENEPHARIGGDNFHLSADGLLMPARKDHSPPDLRYFKKTQK